MGIFEGLVITLVVFILGGTLASMKDDTDTESSICLICLENKSTDHPSLEESAQEGKDALPVPPVDPPAALPHSLR